MHDRLKPLIDRILKQPRLHARWLNTFSFLEYVGFRKIVKSQRAEILDIGTLAHASEEVRHSLLLKRLALKLGGQDFNTFAPETLLCGDEAESYFQNLDRAVESKIAESTSQASRARTTYLYVTWLVEVRALSVYECYAHALKEIGMETPLTGLLADETKHLSYVERELSSLDPAFFSRSAELKRVESELYQVYLDALARELPNRAENAAVI